MNNDELIHDATRTRNHDESLSRGPLLESYACERCGRRDGLDAVATDETWAKLSVEANGANILCLWCMDQLATDLGLTGSVSLHFAGRALYGTSQSDADQDQISRVCRERDDLRRAAEELTYVISQWRVGGITKEDCAQAEQRLIDAINKER